MAPLEDVFRQTPGGAFSHPEKCSMRRLGLLFSVLFLFGCAAGGTVASGSSPQYTIDTTIQAALINDNVAISASFTPAAQQIYQPFFSDPEKMREFGDSLSRTEQIERMD